MKHVTLTLFSAAMLAGCSIATTSIDQENRNPLTAIRYGDELADTLSNLIINNDPIVQDEEMKKRIQRAIETAKSIGNDARAMMGEAQVGAMISIAEEAVGYTALTDGTLYFSSDFFVSPGLNLRVYLTTVVDPRDTDFPDDTAIDLGSIQSVYGAQEYTVQKGQIEGKDIRTVVLYDTTLNRIFGFAQLTSR